MRGALEEDGAAKAGGEVDGVAGELAGAGGGALGGCEGEERGVGLQVDRAAGGGGGAAGPKIFRDVCPDGPLSVRA